MATYKEEHGNAILKVTTDPENPVVGQVWYNSTDQALKGFTSNPAGSWSTGTDLNQSRTAVGGSGIGSGYTSSLAFGGSNDAATVVYGNTESYNGSAWTELADLNQGRALTASAGTTTSALAVLGPPTYSSRNESWNGTAWTELADPNTFRSGAGGGGADNTSAIVFMGSPVPSNGGLTETWNGTAWTEVADLNTSRRFGSGTGIQSSAMAFAGETPSQQATGLTEQWNGTAWTEVGDLSTTRQNTSGSGDTNTSVLCYGGNAPTGTNPTPNAELFNGTSWSEQNNLSTARRAISINTGTSSSCLAAGGATSTGEVATTEEWQSPTLTTVTFTTT